MPFYDLSCNKCGKDFKKILPTIDISDVTCSACDSPDIIKVIPRGSFQAGKKATSIPTGALSGGSCKPGFS